MPATIASRHVFQSRGHAALTASDSPVNTTMLQAWRAVRKVSGSARAATMPATMKRVAQMTTQRPERKAITPDCRKLGTRLRGCDRLTPRRSGCCLRFVAPAQAGARSTGFPPTRERQLRCDHSLQLDGVDRLEQVHVEARLDRARA